ncbi:MAG TPA: beta-propeller fold lactonase family protein [Candidatus Dormibacteraeota bacterium]|nr:beta-propeller fold lactonase family protein [Candidatus Dormibacteraeota bacterium]
MAIALSVAGIGVVSAADFGQGRTTTVYTLSNSATGNAVLAVTERNGHWSPLVSYPTGGNGTGVGLGSQGAIALAEDGSRLVAVNAGSNTLSAFAVAESGRLELIGIASSGGLDPISVTARGRLLYVLNAGNNTVSGIRLGNDGLAPIAGSTHALSAGAQAPVQVSFTPDGESLVIAEKASNTIDVLAVGEDGHLGSPRTTTSTGATPFGFDFDSAGHIVISDAAGGAPGASAVTSYRVGESGALGPISIVADLQTAACWVVVDRGGRHAFTTNTGSGTVSSYDISRGGVLSLHASVAAFAGGHPIDEALGGNGRELFVLDAGGRILSSEVLASGDLGSFGGAATGLPGSVTGLAASSDRD